MPALHQAKASVFHKRSGFAQHGIRAIFIEPNYQGSSAGILSRETGAKLCTLNPVTQGEDSLTAYEGIMRQNAKTIVEAVKNGD